MQGVFIFLVVVFYFLGILFLGISKEGNPRRDFQTSCEVLHDLFRPHSEVMWFPSLNQSLGLSYVSLVLMSACLYFALTA